MTQVPVLHRLVRAQSSRLGVPNVRQQSPLGPATSHRAFDDPCDPGRPQHHLLPREAQHEPPARDELAVTLAVTAEGRSLAVELEAVRLEDDPEGVVAEIDLGEEVVVADAVLRVPVRALDAQSDRAQHRLEGVRGLGGGVALDGEHLASDAVGRAGPRLPPRLVARSPARRAESKTDSASSKGRSRQQSMTVRIGVVTQPSVTSRAASVRRWVVARPRALSRSLRLAGIVTSGSAGPS